MNMNQSSLTSPAHTPGPWFIDLESPLSDICIKPYPGPIVCDVCPMPEAEANAKLIAAAPAMLEHLHSLLEDLVGAKELMISLTEDDSWMRTEDGWNALIRSTEQIIAEASGTEQEPGEPCPACGCFICKASCPIGA